MAASQLNRYGGLLPISQLSEDTRITLKHYLRIYQSWFKQLFYLKIQKYTDRTNNPNELSFMMTMTTDLVTPKIIDLLLFLAGMGQIIISNQAFASLNILLLLLKDFRFDIYLNPVTVTTIIHKHISQSQDFSHVCLYISNQSKYDIKIAQSLEYPLGMQTNISMVQTQMNRNPKWDTRSLVKNYWNDNPSTTQYNLQKWLDWTQEHAPLAMMSQWKCYITHMNSYYCQDAHVDLNALNDPKLTENNEYIVRRMNCFDLRIDYHIYRCYLGKFQVRSNTFKDHKLFDKALQCEKVSEDIQEMLLMVGFGCGVRFYREDQSSQKENLQFDRAIVMIPSGTYDEESALLNGEGMFQNKQIELFEKQEDIIKDEEGQRSRKSSQNANKDSIKINLDEPNIVKPYQNSDIDEFVRQYERDKAIVLLQSAVRARLARDSVNQMREEELEFLGMKFLSSNSASNTEEQELQTFTEDIVTKNIHNSNPGRTQNAVGKMLSILNNLQLGHQQVLGDYNVVDQPIEESNQSIVESVRINLDKNGIPTTVTADNNVLPTTIALDESPSKRFSLGKNKSEGEKNFNITVNNSNILSDLTCTSSQFDGELGSLITESKKTSFKIARKATNDKEYVSLFSDIQLDKKLGQGGEGEVQKSKPIQNKTQAVKIFRIETIDVNYMLQRLDTIIAEQDLFKNIQNSNLVRQLYLDVPYESFDSFIEVKLVMDQIRGVSLAALIKKLNSIDKQLSKEKIVKITKGVLLALKHLHDLNIIHRDLKPSNIMIDENFNAILSDQGISKQLEVNSVTNMDNATKGTPLQLGPEAQERKIPKALDVWSFGCTVLELVTGNRPYYGMPVGMSIDQYVVQQKNNPYDHFMKYNSKNDPNVKQDEELMNLSKCCLKWDQKMRPSVDEILLMEPFK